MHDFAAVTPSRPVEPEARRAKLPHQANAAFLLKYHPLRWMFVDGEWLPQLARMSLSPGVNGIDKGGDDSFARVQADRLGYQIIPRAWGPDVGGGQCDYVNAWPARNGHYHCLVWEHPRAFGERVLDSHVDTAGYHAWLRDLVNSGKLAPPSDDAVALAVDMQRKRAHNAASRAASRHDGAARADAEAEKLAAMSSPPKQRRASRKVDA